MTCLLSNYSEDRDVSPAYGPPAMFNPWPLGHMATRTAAMQPQHKLVNLLQMLADWFSHFCNSIAHFLSVNFAGDGTRSDIPE